MVHLFEQEKKDDGRPSSKGNQLKFCRDGVWYKADYMGYEGLAEYTVSKLLRFSDLPESDYVDYEVEQIEYNGNVYNGCKSRDFADGRMLITLESLYKRSFGESLHHVLYQIEDPEEKLRVWTGQVEWMTGIADFGIYMSKLLTVDALFLNEDRHTHNIAVMTDGKSFEPAPIFDNGLALLSDTMMDYPLSADPIEMMSKVKPSIFWDSFSEQADVAEKLFGTNVHFFFTYRDVCDIVNAADIYSEQIRKRVIDIVMQSRRKYAYLFS